MHAYNTIPRAGAQTSDSAETLLEFLDDITDAMALADDDPEAGYKNHPDPAAETAALALWRSGPSGNEPWRTPEARKAARIRAYVRGLESLRDPKKIAGSINRMPFGRAQKFLSRGLLHRQTPELWRIWLPMLQAKVAGAPITIPSAPQGHGFRFTYDQRDQRALPWTIDGVAVAGSWGYITADTRMGKTFLISHLALCLYMGRAFFGREIRQRGGTAIVAGEAAYATPQRIDAGLQHNFPGTERPAIAYCGAPPNLLNPQTLAQFIDQLRQLSAEMQARRGVPLRMVAFDTLAKCFLVNEDKASEVVQAHNAMERIAEALQVVVITAAHVGKDHSKGTRGSSAHEQNAHFVLKVPAAGVLKLTKQKEAPDDIVLGRFDMPIIELGKDDRGKAITSRAITELTSCPFGEVETPEDATRPHRILRQALKAAGASPSAPLEQIKSKFLPLYPQAKDTNAKQSAKTALRAWQRVLKALPAGITKGEIAGVECLRGARCRRFCHCWQGQSEPSAAREGAPQQRGAQHAAQAFTAEQNRPQDCRA